MVKCVKAKVKAVTATKVIPKVIKVGHDNYNNVYFSFSLYLTC